MATTLRNSILATVAAGIVALAPVAPATAEGRADWKGYAWQQILVSECLPAASGILACPPFHEKWDWKRNQWVDIAVSLDPARGTVSLTQRLTDNDRNDTDYVCVTALLIDSAGTTLAAHHQNWQVGPGEVVERAFTYTARDLATARTIDIGSKQCRQGAGQDDAVYAAVLAGIDG